jgi:hypothetical protein
MNKENIRSLIEEIGIISDHSQGRRIAKSVAFPGWITIPFILLIAFMLWIGVLSDPSGKVKTPGIGSILYILAVIAVAAFLAYSDRNRDSPGTKRETGM